MPFQCLVARISSPQKQKKQQILYAYIISIPSGIVQPIEGVVPRRVINKFICGREVVSS